MKVSLAELVLLILSVFLATFMRILLLPIYPLAMVIVLVALKSRATKACFTLLTLILVSLLFSLFNGFYPKYYLVSLFYMVPFIFTLFTVPGSFKPDSRDLAKFFITCLAIVAGINNIIGFAQVVMHPESDDSFAGIYSSFSVSLNGLSLLNAILFVYYFHIFLAFKNRQHLWWAGFFLISSVMGFYGAGLIVFIASFILVFFKWNLSSIIKVGVVGALLLLVIYYMIGFLNPNALDYNKENLKKITKFDVHNGPRKLTAFYNYTISYPKDIKDFLFGSGPGTFNSRSAFIVGSPIYFSDLTVIKSEEQPYYFRNYAYSLWNPSNTSKLLYQDGFRNQPFSSLLAFLGEYGLLFSLFFAWYYHKQYRQIVDMVAANPSLRNLAYRRIVKFLFCFLGLLLVIDNYHEYPEITLLILVLVKLLHIEIRKEANIDTA